MQVCSVDDFLKIGLASDDIITVEKKIDIFVEVTPISAAHSLHHVGGSPPFPLSAAPKRGPKGDNLVGRAPAVRKPA